MVLLWHVVSLVQGDISLKMQPIMVHYRFIRARKNKSVLCANKVSLVLCLLSFYEASHAFNHGKGNCYIQKKYQRIFTLIPSVSVILPPHCFIVISSCAFVIKIFKRVE